MTTSAYIREWALGLFFLSKQLLRTSSQTPQDVNMVGHISYHSLNWRLIVLQGSVVSAIGSAIEAVVGAIAGLIMSIVSGVTMVCILHLRGATLMFIISGLFSDYRDHIRSDPSNIVLPVVLPMWLEKTKNGDTS
jgi:uncharacterized oligopeptide transporter (OPT) family protein